jgi:hypothetical protein
VIAVFHRAVSSLRGRLRAYNAGQRRVFWGMAALLFVNALILTSGIVLLSLLLKRLLK